MDGKRGKAMVTRSKDAMGKNKKQNTSTAASRASSTSVLPTKVSETRTTELRKRQNAAAALKTATQDVQTTWRLSSIPSRPSKKPTADTSTNQLLKNVKMSGAGPRNIAALLEKRKLAAAQNTRLPDKKKETTQVSTNSLKLSDSKLRMKSAVPVKRLAVPANEEVDKGANIKKTRFDVQEEHISSNSTKGEDEDQEESLKDVFFTPFQPRPKTSVESDPELQRNLFDSPSFDEPVEDAVQVEETPAVPEVADTSDIENRRWSCLVM